MKFTKKHKVEQSPAGEAWGIWERSGIYDFHEVKEALRMPPNTSVTPPKGGSGVSRPAARKNNRVREV